MMLYKYMPLTWSEELPDSERKLNCSRCECIKNNRFWFSSPKTLNDPYDCRPFFKRISRLKDIELILADMNDKEMEFVLKSYPKCHSSEDIVEFHRRFSRNKHALAGNTPKHLLNWLFQTLTYAIVNAKIQNVGILSLTTDYTSCVMWSHYAKNHEGICIEIEMPQNTKGLKSVVYAHRQPSLTIYEANHEKLGKLTELFYTKSKNWKYESEWRIVALTGNGPEPIPGTRVTKIIYGLNTSKITKLKVEQSIGTNVETHQMKMMRNYSLKLDKVV